MPHPRGSASGVHVGNDFVEADLDTAFALLYVAETEALSGERAAALRAIEEAEKAIVDGASRLRALETSDRERLGIQVERMREVVQGIRSALG